MDIDRALLTSALQSGAIAQLLASGISATHFALTPSGQQVAEVFEWASAHTRRYNVSPSQQLLKERFPDWHGEPSADPLEALIDAFLGHVKRRAFSAKVLELAQAESDPSRWPYLDELMLDAARDLSALVPSGAVGRMSEMTQRIEQYERERDEGIIQGTLMGIPPIDDITAGMQRGDVVTISGFSGRGKSLLAKWILMNAFDQERNGLLLSLEMSRRQVFERLDTMVMNFSHRLLRRRALEDAEVELWRRVAAQYASLGNDLVVVDRLMGCTIDRVYAEINRYRPDITVVDYVQLMRRSRASMQTWEGLVEITNELKAIALATDSVIVMVSQDGRGSAEDGSTERNMGGSISVFQAADLYLGLHQTEDMRTQDRMEVRLLKNRTGEPLKQAYLDWKPHTMSFAAIDENASAAQAFKREPVAA